MSDDRPLRTVPGAREITQAESYARDADILRRLRAMTEAITGQKNGGDLWQHLEEIHDAVKAGQMTITAARQSLGLEREHPADPLA